MKKNINMLLVLLINVCMIASLIISVETANNNFHGGGENPAGWIAIICTPITMFFAVVTTVLAIIARILIAIKKLNAKTTYLPIMIVVCAMSLFIELIILWLGNIRLGILVIIALGLLITNTVTIIIDSEKRRIEEKIQIDSYER